MTTFQQELEHALVGKQVEYVGGVAGRHHEKDGSAIHLGRKGLIRPSTTQGHIGDVTRTDIVFDAPTTEGGSGGPVFSKEGVVVAVEYAVLSKFGGNAFGVPMHFAVELLKPPGKKAATK